MAISLADLERREVALIRSLIERRIAGQKILASDRKLWVGRSDITANQRRHLVGVASSVFAAIPRPPVGFATADELKKGMVGQLEKRGLLPAGVEVGTTIVTVPWRIKEEGKRAKIKRLRIEVPSDWTLKQIRDRAGEIISEFLGDSDAEWRILI